jgi:hypothetical protein
MAVFRRASLNGEAFFAFARQEYSKMSKIVERPAVTRGTLAKPAKIANVAVMAKS